MLLLAHIIVHKMVVHYDLRHCYLPASTGRCLTLFYVRVCIWLTLITSNPVNGNRSVGFLLLRLYRKYIDRWLPSFISQFLFFFFLNLIMCHVQIGALYEEWINRNKHFPKKKSFTKYNRIVKSIFCLFLLIDAGRSCLRLDEKGQLDVRV